MEALKGIKNIKIYDNTMFHLEDCIVEYQKYISLLEGLEMRELAFFLRTLRRNELINNQETENEPTLLMELESEMEKVSSIEMMANIIDSKQKITPEDIRKIHKRLLRGTNDDNPRNYPYRTFPVRVSSIEDGKEQLHYIPPEPEEIIPYMEYILDYLNDDNNLQMETVFIKPIIAHAYISILQPFGNGNTRVARLLQYGKIYDLTNKYFGKNFPHPILYLSKNYLLTRSGYRGKIEQIAKNHDDTSWNKWFEYNLNMIDEQLYYVINNLEQYYRRKK